MVKFAAWPDTPLLCPFHPPPPPQANQAGHRVEEGVQKAQHQGESLIEKAAHAVGIHK